MPLTIKVTGIASAKRMADTATIRISFKRKSFHRNQTSTELFKAIEKLQESLEKISPSSDKGPSRFQATSDGPIASWDMQSPTLSTNMTALDSKSKLAYEISHKAEATFKIEIRDLRVLHHVSNAIIRLRGILQIKTDWSLSEIAQTRLVAEVYKLASEDALNKATAVTSSIGFNNLTASEMTMDTSKIQHASSHHFGSNDREYYDSPFHHRTTSRFPESSEFSGQDEAGDLDTWVLVLAPEEIEFRAIIQATFTATPTSGWVYEGANRHRFLTN